MRHTGGGRRRGAAPASELLQRVDSHVEVDVLAATPLVHQLLLLKGLKPKKTRPVRKGSRPRHAWRRRGGRTYQLKGVFLRGAKLDTLVDEGFEVALADVGGNFGPELGGDDGPLQETALRRRRGGVNDCGRVEGGAGDVGRRGGGASSVCSVVGYLGGGRVRHPLLRDGGCGLGHHASKRLGFDGGETLAGRRHSAGVWLDRSVRQLQWYKVTKYPRRFAAIFLLIY